ncbi:sterol desaturase family protein [Tenacibaculum finnmarkense]|uniref:sterol desaturase family protein n=1 Tax=Tenacibaculum finnmarkense TaxID=2781243 RepID=UPI001EFA5955|nr:sterol desaturase family protein [Tenacibaculum finnmarkense]MCG8803185.1 sterol desaturase family protein [Tenacibaculum finnmarkense]MCG8826000.1 sterol desaturase family protein [Tenacibaculum finnmarkense]
MSLNEVINILEEVLKIPFLYLLNPRKRIYFLYLASAIVLAYYMYTKNKIKSSFWSYLFPLKNWKSSSAYTDYGLLFFNAFVKVLLLAPYFVFGLYIAFYTKEYFLTQFGETHWEVSQFTVLLTYTFAMTLVNDFMSFLIHYIFHKVPFLWEFHKIHHSATHLNPLTQYRLHPVELIINNIKSILIFGLITGFFDYISFVKISKLTFIGVNIFSFIFLFFGSNLRHSHIKLTYFNFLEYIFISPFQHQIHHSNNQEHFDKNMGSKLALWDWLFGTLLRSEQVGNISYGLGLGDDKNYNTFLKNLYKPFTNLFFQIKGLILRFYSSK